MSQKENEKQLCGPDVLVQMFGFADVRSINDLVNSGIITPTIVMEGGKKVRKYDLVQTVTQYVLHLKEKMRRKGVDKETVNAAADADTRYRVAKADKLEMEVRELRGELHRSEDVKSMTEELVMTIRSALLALPGRLAVNVAATDDPAIASALISAEVNETLNALAEHGYDSQKYAALVREREKWMKREAELEELKEAKILAKTQKKPAKRNAKRN